MSLSEATCATAEATESLGEAMADRVRAGDVILLKGDLAAGKTTLVRGLARGLGGDPDEVSSPTFVIVQSYPCRHRTVSVLHHVDLYRLSESPTQLRDIGLEELLSEPDAVTAVEWPKQAVVRWMPDDARCWSIELSIEEGGSRRVRVRSP